MYQALSQSESSIYQATNQLERAASAGIVQPLPLSLLPWVPKIAILFCVELLAGFLLRQYRIAMEEFRYHENVLHNRELPIAAYLARREFGDKNALATLADELARDRSSGVLKENEADVVLEAERNSHNEFNALLQMLGRFAPRSKQ
jgi:hypothetical protein